MEIEFIPYLIKDGNKTIKFGKNKLTEYILSKKMKKIKVILNKILWPFTIKKYNFDNNIIKTKLESSNKYLKNLKSEEDIKQYFFETYGNSKHLIGETAPDTWMEGDIILIKENDFDKNIYEFGIATKKIVFPKLRPSPTDSATLFKIGTIKKGNDGNKWLVKKVGESVRWVKIKKEKN